MKVFIPEIGSRLRLDNDWTFTVVMESRNASLYQADGHPDPDWREADTPTYTRTLPKGSLVQVDRIYVRQGAEDWSSLTFYLVETSDPVLSVLKRRKQPFTSGGTSYLARFWVKLPEVNEAELTVEYDATQPLVDRWDAQGTDREVVALAAENARLRRVVDVARRWDMFDAEDTELEDAIRNLDRKH